MAKARRRILGEPGLIHFSLSDAEVLPRPYGIMHRISPVEARFEKLQVLLMTIDPGKATSRHHHPNEEVFFVLAGEAVLETRTGEHILREGDIAAIRPGERHQLENRSAVECRVIIALSPPRDPALVVYG